MKNKILLICIGLLVILNIYWFWPGNLYFLNDDLLHIPLTDKGYLFQTNSVRPIHELLVRLDLLLWGKSAYGYHITALVLHLVVCIQLYNLAWLIQVKWLQVERQQAITASLLAVFLFLVYPQSSESLSWILGRASILSTIFLMTTLRLFFAQKHRLAAYAAGAFFFAASLFTYEQAVLLPVGLLLIAFAEKDKLKKQFLFWYAGTFSVVVTGYVIVRKLITAEVVGGYEGGNLLDGNWKILAGNMLRLIFRLVLNPAYKIAFVCSVILLLLAVILIVVRIPKLCLNKKGIIIFLGAVILFLVPIISLGLPVNSFESGRYLYMPSVFFITGISVASVAVYHQNEKLRRPLILLLTCLTVYWLWGKNVASKNYTGASFYARSVEKKVQQHFKNTSDTLYIDTLFTSVHRLPVFRLGFKTGIKWLNENIDTNKILVKHYYDEVNDQSIK